MSASPSEDFTPDETRLLDKLKASYERAVDTAAASRQIESVNEPTFVHLRDDDGKPVSYGRVPSWQEVAPSKDELTRIQKLEAPTGVISIPAMSLATKVEIAKTLPLPLVVWSNFDLGADETGDLVSWNPGNPKKAFTKVQRLDSGLYTAGGADVLFMDGGDEVPDETLKMDAYDFRDLCLEQGVIQPDIDAYFAFQTEGARRGKHFDSGTISWLNAYLKSSRAAVFGRWDLSVRGMGLREDDPLRSNSVLGGRRAVRVRKKS